MARQTTPIEVNKFNLGLVTDASPLTSPDNSSLEEDNMVLNIDGSRNRRLGMDFEAGFTSVTTTISNASSVDVASASYKWKNAGGNPAKSLLVIQFGTEIKVFDLDQAAVSTGLLYTYNFAGASPTQVFSYAVVDGILVVATGLKDLFSFEFSAPSTFTLNTFRLLIRDFFGVEDVIAGFDMIEGNNVSNRPGVIDDQHLYNLRNQTWGVTRVNGDDAGVVPPVFDPVETFRSASGNTVWPSNSDNVVEALYPNAEVSDNRTIERFYSADLYRSPLGTNRAPQGYFIIDALDRGTSRLAQDAANRSRYPEITMAVLSLPLDSTPNGATCIAEFAGRVWYGGFTGEVVGGDSKSPRMSSYILFSKVVDSSTVIGTCYQEGDPTSSKQPEIIDTDGGFIRINEAYGIVSLINLGSSLVIVAKNGIWRVIGGTDNGFTATSYIVEKISDKGCPNASSIVLIDNSFMYWGEDGIYYAHPNQYGDWVSDNITFGKIQKLYDAIPVEDRQKAVGNYDSYEHKIRWLYHTRTTDTTPSMELVLDTNLQSFSTFTIKQFEGTAIPKVVGLYSGNPYKVDATKELAYVVITSFSPTVVYSFARYSDINWRDWFSSDGVGIDADAYLITSYLSGSDFQRDKRVPYITVHSRRTEEGFEEVGDELVPINKSSILMQARWDWSDTSNSNKWGREFQAYRYRRLYIPVDVNDNADNGFTTVVTRNKLRGNGKVLSLRFRTEPYNNFHLYGWSMLFSVAENV